MDGTTSPDYGWGGLVNAAYEQTVRKMLECESVIQKMWAAEAANLPPLTRRQKFRRSRYRFYAKVQRVREWVASAIAGYDVTDRGDW